MRPLRIGCVPYLNAKPLLAGLSDVTLLPPADLVARLAAGRLDAALIPTIEVLRREWSHVPGLAIASPGATDSVRLWLRKPLDQVRVVALDRNSRTTNALARILLEKRHGLSPRYVAADPAKGLRGDAAVTIGDASFKDYGLPSLDLGAEWRRFAGKPFVFALWAHEEGHPRASEIRRVLRAAAKSADLAGIIEREHARVGITRERCRTYLTECITYGLGAAERAGIRLFEKHARSLGLLEPVELAV